MIYVRKPPQKPPADFVDKAKAELENARAHFNGRRTRAAPFKFRAYDHQGVRDTLNEIFHYKCAYCESFFGATQPVAIEHFRPKGMITEGKRQIRPGYWWLAAAWSNLLPSCTDCNSPRWKKGPEGKMRLSGKGNQFPIGNPDRRARSEGEEKQERPLLLDPCNGRVRPEQHLEFFLDAQDRGLVRAALDRRGNPSMYGETSILVYALDRDGLIRGRQAAAKRLKFRIEDARVAYERMRKRPRNRAARAEFDRRIAELKSYLADDQPYAGMCRQLVERMLPVT